MQQVAVKALTLLVAITVGAIGAAAANFVGWRLESPLPTVKEATAALRAGLPDVPVASVAWHDDVRDIHLIEHPTAANLPGQRQVDFRDGAISREAFQSARERLAAAGWRTDPGPSVVDGGAFFVASRGDLVMEWEFSPSGTYTEPAGDSIEVWIWKFTPPRLKVLTMAGWLLGAVLGWWLARRVLGMAAGGTRTTLAVLLGTLSVILAVSTVSTAYFTVHGLLDLPIRDGQPTALRTCYFPFLALFGFRLG